MQLLRFGSRPAGSKPLASMVVDIGGGSAEVGVISLGGIVCSTSVRVAATSLDSSLPSNWHPAAVTAMPDYGETTRRENRSHRRHLPRRRSANADQSCWRSNWPRASRARLTRARPTKILEALAERCEGRSSRR